MLTKTRRFALATAMLWLAFGVGSKAQADLTAPMGLSPGAAFRFVFVTDGTTTATSSDISTYNTFVNNQAAGATYNGSVITWYAIASTSTVNAIDNVVGPNVAPVYLPDGTLVTTSTTSTGLWSGTLSHAINEDLNGTMVASTAIVFTGTGQSGTAASPNPFGSIQGVTQAGFTSSTGTSWTNGQPQDASQPLPLYGISQILIATPTVAVPEPSTLWMAASGICAGVAFRWNRRRRQQQR